MPNYLCVINEAGPANYGATSNPNVYINLTDTGGSFADTWFYVADGIQNQALAVGIAAIIRSERLDVTAVAPNVGGSPYTEITRMLPSRPLAPAAPTGLYVSKLTAASEGRSIIEFAWMDNSGGEAAFILVYQGELAGNLDDLQETTNLKATSYAFNVLNGHTYIALVSASNIAGRSMPDKLTGSIPGEPPEPASPTGLQVTVSANGANESLITLRWTDNSDNETGFTISFTAIAGAGVTLAPINVPANTVTYPFSVVNNGTTYDVNVKAYNSSGSSIAAAATFTVPPPSVASPASITASVNPNELTGGGTEWDLDINGSNFGDGETIQLVITWWASNDGEPNAYPRDVLANIVGGFTYAFPGVNGPPNDTGQRFQIQATGLTSHKIAMISI
jgi:hypothetical protein